MSTNWHDIADKCLDLEASGCIDFKLLRELLHNILHKLDANSCDDIPMKISLHQPELTIASLCIPNEISHLSQRIESLHDSMSRNIPEKIEIPKKSDEICERLEQKFSIMEESVCAVTNTINDIAREFQVIKEQISGEVEEIEDLKESLDELRHHLQLKNNVQVLSVDNNSNETKESTKGKFSFSIIYSEHHPALFYLTQHDVN